MKEKDILYIDNVVIGKVNSCEPIGYQMNDIFALTAYDWEFTTHYLYNIKEIPDKNELDKIWKIAYASAKSKIRSGIRTEPDSQEILIEMVNLLKENGIYPLKIWNYDVDNKEVRKEDSL